MDKIPILGLVNFALDTSYILPYDKVHPLKTYMLHGNCHKVQSDPNDNTAHSYGGK